MEKDTSKIMEELGLCPDFKTFYHENKDYMLTGIALLFGIGNAFDSLVSAAAYAHLLKKQKINILKVE